MPAPKIRSTKINWSLWTIIGSSIPIVLIITGIIKVRILETSHSIVDTSTEHAVFFICRYIALPLGLLSLIAGINDFKKGLVKKRIAVAEILISIPNILLGLIAWIWFFTFLALTGAFS